MPVDDLKMKILNARGHSSRLPGQFDMQMVSDLFYEDSTHWPSLLESTADQIETAVERCLRDELAQAAGKVKADEVAPPVHDEVVRPAIRSLHETLRSRVEDFVGGHAQRRLLEFSDDISSLLPLARARETRRR
jgi:hypothetical protein